MAAFPTVALVTVRHFTEASNIIPTAVRATQPCMQEPTPVDAAARITAGDLEAMASDRPTPAAPGSAARGPSDAAPSEPAPLGGDVPASPEHEPQPQQPEHAQHQPPPAAPAGGCVVGIPVHVPQVRPCSS